VLDFYDTKGERRWITMPKGSKRKDAVRHQYINSDPVLNIERPKNQRNEKEFIHILSEERI
jgi:hypothetical protein